MDINLEALSKEELIDLCRKNSKRIEWMEKENSHLKSKIQDCFDTLNEIRQWSTAKQDGTFAEGINAHIVAINVRARRNLEQMGVVMMKHFKEMQILWAVAHECSDILNPESTQEEVLESTNNIRDLLDRLLSVAKPKTDQTSGGKSWVKPQLKPSK